MKISSTEAELRKAGAAVVPTLRQSESLAADEGLVS